MKLLSEIKVKFKANLRIKKIQKIPVKYTARVWFGYDEVDCFQLQLVGMFCGVIAETGDISW